jgi:ribose/xylose/arabinose/galactoside ABC-type transport system permease subunit
MSTPTSERWTWLSRWWPLRFHETALLGAILIVFVSTVLVDQQQAYIHKKTWFLCLEDIVRSFSLHGVVALGAMVVIISGGIDLSVGSLIALCAVVTASTLMFFAGPEDQFLQHVGAGPVVVAIAAAMLTGLLVGTLHTWLITSIELPPFVATLATLVGLRSFARVLCEYAKGLKYGVSSASDIYVSHPFFTQVVKNPWVMLTVFLCLAGITWFLLTFTVIGRHTYALGGNEQAARLSGIRTTGVKWFVYCFAALTAAVAGIFNLANGGGAQPAGQAAGYELTAIAAAVVGGCSLRGGAGSVPGTLLGAFFLRLVIDSIYRIIDTSADKYEGMIVGVVVALAVTFTQLRALLQSGRQFFAGTQGLASLGTIAVFGGTLITMFSVYTPALKERGGLVWLVATAVLALVLLGFRTWEARRAEQL